MDDLYINLNAYRTSLEYEYINELDIIRKLKIYLIDLNFNIIETNFILYNFYNYINVPLSFSIINNVISDIFINTVYYFSFNIEYNNTILEDKRVSVEKINTLEIKIYESTELDICCPICLEIMKINDKYFKLKCNHIYHTECLEHYLKNYNNICPMCKINLF